MKTKFLALMIAISISYLPSAFALPDLSGTYKCTGTVDCVKITSKVDISRR